MKNLLLDPERTYRRKIREAILARRLEQELSKDEILELYLNHIYFGHGRYGIEEASRDYFGKSAKDVTIAEAALLAGCRRAPSSTRRATISRSRPRDARSCSSRCTTRASSTTRSTTRPRTSPCGSRPRSRRARSSRPRWSMP